MAKEKLFVSNKDESPRIFRNAVLDYFSRVHFSVPLLFYMPVIGFFLYQSFAKFHLPALQVAGLFLLAILAWTLFEYVMHRFIFHYEPTSELGKRIHFLTHGVHHDFPNDHLRLVMPLGVSIPLAVFFFGLFYLTMGAAWSAPFFAGFVFGYLLYDMIHYATHHVRWKLPLFKKIQKHHMTHHFREPEKGFSVSVIFWDNVFGTTYNKRNKSRS